MSIESATYISQLDAAKPAGTDGKAEGDDMIRLIKFVLQSQFPNLGAAAVTPTAAQLNTITSFTTNGLMTMVVETGTTNTAVAGQHIVCTNAGATTVTLPASPSAGNEVRVTVANDLFTNVIDPGTSKLMGSNDDMTINQPYATVWLRYVNSTLGWRIV